MSSAANIKVISQSQSDAGVSSSLPLPQSTRMPLPKMDPKQQHISLPNPAMQYQRAAKRQPALSSSSASSGPTDLLRGTAFKNQLLQQKTSMYSNRGPTSTERSDGTCSAYSSPRVPKKELSRSKDTLDLRNSSVTQKALRDLQFRRNTNRNWTFGTCRLSNVDNAREGDALQKLSADVQSGHRSGRLLYPKGSNGNEMSRRSSTGQEHFQRHVSNVSNQGLMTSDRDTLGNKSKDSYLASNVKRRGSEPAKITMAAVAPFRFR